MEGNIAVQAKKFAIQYYIRMGYPVTGANIIDGTDKYGNTLIMLCIGTSTGNHVRLMFKSIVEAYNRFKPP